MDNKTFKIGEYKGNTYQHVRINHPEYFLKLVCLPAGNVQNILISLLIVFYTDEDLKRRFCTTYFNEIF